MMYSQASHGNTTRQQSTEPTNLLGRLGSKQLRPVRFCKTQYLRQRVSRWGAISTSHSVFQRSTPHSSAQMHVLPDRMLTLGAALVKLLAIANCGQGSWGCSLSLPICMQSH